MQQTWVWFLGWKDPLEEGLSTHSIILAWRNQWIEEPGGIQSIGSQRVRHDWRDWAHMHMWSYYHFLNCFGFVLCRSFPSLVFPAYRSSFTVCRKDGFVVLNSLKFACMESFWFLHQLWMRVLLGRVFSNVGSSLSVQFSLVTQSCPTLWDPMNCSTPGLPVHHQLLEFTQTHVHQISDAIQPSHPLSSPSPLAPNPSQHQSLFQWVNSLHESTLHGQSTGVSALASFLPKKSQSWSPSEWTCWISLQSKGLSRVFSNTTVQKHQFFSAQPSSQSNSHIHTWLLEKP